MTDGQSATQNEEQVRIQPEVVANPEFITWKYPPYCELCNVQFPSEQNSETHFKGKNHTNRLQIWRKYQNPTVTLHDSKTVLCDVCWKEMNTKEVLNTHRKSPAHKNEERGRLIVQKLKEEYRQLKESKQNN